MSSPKFPLELRLAVVTHYLNSRDGYRETANRSGVGRTAVRRWVSARRFAAGFPHGSRH
ncbi:helix-turn-helix domain-containing protein [Pantoea agglomerans]|uniref:helix-turn-helix domain-containing protein n=1 Tax=Enterobacter agglomerans TaxID=549 RepID=UPI001CA41D30